jgi:hypothetical protein
VRARATWTIGERESEKEADSRLRRSASPNGGNNDLPCLRIVQLARVFGGQDLGQDRRMHTAIGLDFLD